MNRQVSVSDSESDTSYTADLIQTDAVKNYIIPHRDFKKDPQWIAYAEEADIVNVALFGFTAKAWREMNPELAKKNNVRDFATIHELTVLSNLETHNAHMIREGKNKEERFQILKEIAEYQFNILSTAEQIKMAETCDDRTLFQPVL